MEAVLVLVLVLLGVGVGVDIDGGVDRRCSALNVLST